MSSELRILSYCKYHTPQDLSIITNDLPPTGPFTLFYFTTQSHDFLWTMISHLLHDLCLVGKSS